MSYQMSACCSAPILLGLCTACSQPAQAQSSTPIALSFREVVEYVVGRMVSLEIHHHPDKYDEPGGTEEERHHLHELYSCGLAHLAADMDDNERLTLMSALKTYAERPTGEGGLL